MRFKKFNNNPTGRKKGDCVVRALSIALDKGWLEIYDDLTKLGRELKTMPNNKEVYEEYLKNYESKSQRVKKGEKRMTAQSFGNGTYILRQAGHLVTIKNGILTDTWDCRKRAVYKYWVIEKGIKTFKLSQSK